MHYRYWSERTEGHKRYYNTLQIKMIDVCFCACMYASASARASVCVYVLPFDMPLSSPGS